MRARALISVGIIVLGLAAVLLLVFPARGACWPKWEFGGAGCDDDDVTVGDQPYDPQLPYVDWSTSTSTLPPGRVTITKVTAIDIIPTYHGRHAAALRRAFRQLFRPLDGAVIGMRFFEDALAAGARDVAVLEVVVNGKRLCRVRVRDDRTPTTTTTLPTVLAPKFVTSLELLPMCQEFPPPDYVLPLN